MNEKISMVFIVTYFNYIKGVFANLNDAIACQSKLTSEGYMSEVICRPLNYQFNSNNNE